MTHVDSRIQPELVEKNNAGRLCAAKFRISKRPVEADSNIPVVQLRHCRRNVGCSDERGTFGDAEFRDVDVERCW